MNWNTLRLDLAHERLKHDDYSQAAFWIGRAIYGLTNPPPDPSGPSENDTSTGHLLTFTGSIPPTAIITTREPSQGP